MRKVSDFKLAAHFLKMVAKSHDTTFVDVGVRFGATAEVGTGARTQYDEHGIWVYDSEKLSTTLVGIIGTYLAHWGDITGDSTVLLDNEQSNLLKLATAVVRSYVYAEGTLPETDPASGLRMTLTQFPLVWLLLRDIVSPVYGCELKDVSVLAARHPHLDAAQILTAGDEHNVPESEAPVIFVNLEVESDSSRNASLMVEAIKSLGLDPLVVVSGLMADPEIKKTVKRFVTLAFVVENEISNFLVSLGSAAGLPVHDSLLDGRDSDVWRKQAQSGEYGGPMSPGGQSTLPQLTEALIDSARGPDFSVTKILKPYVEELWGRIADEKRRRGKEDMSIEDMLRVQSRGLRVRPNTLLQELLSEQRIW